MADGSQNPNPEPVEPSKRNIVEDQVEVVDEPEVAADSGRCASLPPVSKGVENLCQSHRLARMTPHQRLVYALTARTLVEYRSDLAMVIAGIVLVPLIVVIGAAAGLLTTWGLEWLLSWVGLADAAVYFLAALVLVGGKALRDLAREPLVSIYKDGARADRFKIGRLEDILHVTAPALNGLFFGALFGVQVAILAFAPSHGGLEIEGGLADSLLLTIDNVCHGLFFDTFELYDVRWGMKPEHTFVSASIFLAFRVAFDATALLLGYSIWKRYRMRHLLRWLPDNERDADGMLGWIETRCADKHCWPSRYHDEFLFLLLAKEFIAGNNDFVGQLSGKLTRLRVEPEVRAIFQAPDGTVVFHGDVPQN